MEREILEMHENVCNYIYPQIKNRSEGVLHQVIHTLFNKEEAEEICIDLDVKDDASLENDEEFINQLIAKPNFLAVGIPKSLTNVINPRMEKLYWIILVACTLLGIWFSNRNINKRLKKSKRDVETQTNHLLTDLPLPIPKTAALCLVVPASVVVDIRDNHQNGLEDNCVNAFELEMLMDNASYFLCATIEFANSKQSNLELTDEEISIGSRRDVYIRVHIDNGQEMLNKDILYILKRNLPDHGQRIIQKYACLGNLKGLEVFNRV